MDRPAAGARILHDQLHQLVPMADPPLLLLVRFIDIVAIGADGIAWATPRLCVDDLQVVRAGPDGIVCSCDNLGDVLVTVMTGDPPLIPSRRPGDPLPDQLPAGLTRAGRDGLLRMGARRSGSSGVAWLSVRTSSATPQGA